MPARYNERRGSDHPIDSGNQWIPVERFSMNSCRPLVCGLIVALALLTGARDAGAQTESRFSLDLGVGIDVGVNGNVNSGAIGTLQGQAAAILPNPYSDVYGTGINLRVGTGYWLNDQSELRAVLTFQSADADLVRLGDLGQSALYAQYSDYQSTSLDLGYRRYVKMPRRDVSLYGEGTLGIGFIDSLNVLLAAPQSNLVFDNTDFYDQTAAFTWGLNAGVLFRLNERLDLNAQFGLRHVSGLSDVDSLEGTDLEDINNDSGRLTVPIVVGLRFRFK